MNFASQSGGRAIRADRSEGTLCSSDLLFADVDSVFGIVLNVHSSANNKKRFTEHVSSCSVSGEPSVSTYLQKFALRVGSRSYKLRYKPP